MQKGRPQALALMLRRYDVLPAPLLALQPAEPSARPAVWCRVDLARAWERAPQTGGRDELVMN